MDRESNKQTHYQCTLVLKASPRDTQRVERIGVMNIEEHIGIFHTATESSFQLVSKFGKIEKDWGSCRLSVQVHLEDS